MVGAGVTLLVMLLMFISLGVVGLSAPMVSAVAGLLCSLGGGWGYRVGLNGESLEAMGEGVPFAGKGFQQRELVPFVAYFYGTVTLVVFHIFVVERSFYFGLAAMFFTLLALFYLGSRKALSQWQVKEQIKRQILLGLSITYLFSLLTWNGWSLAGGLLFTLMAVVMTYRQMEEGIPTATTMLKETDIESYLHVSPERLLQTDPEPSSKRKTVYSCPAASCLGGFWSVLLVFLVCGIAGYLLFPWSEGAAWKGVVSALLIGFIAFLLGALIDRYVFLPRGSHAENQ